MCLFNPGPSPKPILLFCQSLELLYELPQWPQGAETSFVEPGPMESQGPGAHITFTQGVTAPSKEHQECRVCEQTRVVSADESVPWEMKEGRLPG